MKLILLVLGCQLAAAQTPGQVLRGRLEAGLPVVATVLGDSLTDGMNVPAPQEDAFPALFGWMLRQRWPNVPLTLNVAGVAGADTADGLRRFSREVTGIGAHLAVIQFGGNDKGFDDGLDRLETYRANLRKLIAQCAEAGIACLVMTPPMAEPVKHMPYPVAAREVAAEMGVPAALVDTRLKDGLVDYRGLFPSFIHPREHEHAQMALALYDAFRQLIGDAGRLQAVIPPAVVPVATLGSVIELPVTVSDPAMPVDGRLVTVHDWLPRRGVALPTGEPGQALWRVPVSLPALLTGGRSMEWPLRLQAASLDEAAFDLRRVTVVPRLAVPAAGSREAFEPAAWLDRQACVLGANRLGGPADLSARLHLSCDDQSLTVRVAVRDEVYRPERGAPYGDALEVYLDLRDDQTRGQPVFSERCASLFINLGQQAEGRAEVVLYQPAEEVLSLETIGPAYRRTADGYEVELTFDRGLLDTIAGRRVTALGFDLAIDDDDGMGRESQLMWVGRADNIVNPRRWAELVLDGTAQPGEVRVTVW